MIERFQAGFCDDPDTENDLACTMTLEQWQLKQAGGEPIAPTIVIRTEEEDLSWMDQL